MRTRSSCARGVIMKGICLRCTTKPHTDNEFVCNHSMPHAGDWPQSRFPDVPETPEQVSMDVPETSKASTGEPESPKQASTGEPESPKQASTGVPQTPSSSEPRWQEGKDIAADTGHGCPGAHTICPGVATMHAQEFRHWCRFCRRRRYAKASVGNGGRDIVQRFQEWALPYLVDTKGENHLFQQVRVAVGPRIEEFAGIPCHVLKAVGREWLEDRALLKSVSCICSTRTVQTEQVKTENGRYKNLPRSNAREHDRLPFVAPAPQKRFSAAASSEFASPVVPHSKVCQLGLEIQSHACDATLSRSGKKLSYQAQASIQPDEVRRDCPTYYGKTTQIEGVATAKLLLAGSSVTHGAHGTHASIQNASRPTFGRLQFCCYKGGGYENEQSFQQICFFCGNNVPPYKPYHLENKYGTHCVLCRRYTCSACCQWELGKPYCTWCAKHGPRISVDHRRMNSRGRAVSRSCKAWKETVDWLDMLEFVRDRVALHSPNLPCAVNDNEAMPDSTELQNGQGMDFQSNALKRCRREVSVNVQEIVYGLLLSKYGDENRVQEVFAQNWVPDWDGWLQGKDADTDEDYMQLMTRFEAVAKANVPVNVKSNRARLAELETQGLTLIVASPHGANNCLIDSLLLGLIRSGILTCSGDILQRQHVCEACRAYLKTEHGIEEGIYLDGHRDGPRILYYLLAIRWPRAVVLQVRFYDRLDQNDFSEELREELNSIEFSWGPLLQRVRCELHIFNHTHSDGNGYHFDLLWRSHAGGRHLTERSDGQTPSEQRIDDSPRSRDGAAPWPATTARQEGPIDTAPKLAENNQPQVNRSASSKRSFDIGSALQMQLSDPVSPDNTCGRLVEKAPAAENFDHMDAAASAGDGPDGGPPVTDLHAAPTTSPKRDHTVASADARTMLGGDDLRACLQNFLSARSQAPIRIEGSDVNSLRAKWNNMADVGAQLQVWLGASMPNFEPTRKNALLLAKQWMRFYIACTQEIESNKKKTVSGGRQPRNSERGRSDAADNAKRGGNRLREKEAAHRRFAAKKRRRCTL